MRIMTLLFGVLLVGCTKVVEPESAPEPVEEAAPAWQPDAPPVDDLIYFVMVDRFANGDAANDGAIDLEDPTAFHGGDIQGVIDRLDYLEGLGVRTVWLSPVFGMRTEKFFEWGAFHGYWMQDPTSVEPRFGDAALLRELSDQLHARGMRLLLDVVWNHVSFDAPLKSEHPDWFHQHGGIEDWDDPFELVNHEVHGLPDFAQENPEVYGYLRDASLGWVRDVQPDGFRVDAVRHMPTEFLASISADLRDEAGPGFFLLGEDFQGDPVALAETYEQGGFGSMFDFPMHYAMLDVFCDDRHPGRLAAMLSGDSAYPDAQQLVTFLDNHDLPRITSRCHDDLGRVRRALAFQLTTRGIPAITWGIEAGLEGAGEPENRADMVFGSGHPLEEDIRTLLDFRRRHPALMEGVTMAPETATGRMEYQRSAGGEHATVSYYAAPTQGVIELPSADGEALVVGEEIEVFTLDPEIERRTVTLGQDTLVVIVTTTSTVPQSSTSAEPVPLRVEATGVSLGDGDDLVLTGSGRALGNWNPAEPAGVFVREGDLLVLELEQPAHTVLEVKLVVRHPDGAVDWQDGENRYLGVAGESSSQRLSWSDRATP
jgi:glycosidase